MITKSRLLLIAIVLNFGFSQSLDIWAPAGDENRIYSAGETIWISWDLWDDVNGDGHVDLGEDMDLVYSVEITLLDQNGDVVDIIDDAYDVHDFHDLSYGYVVPEDLDGGVYTVFIESPDHPDASCVDDMTDAFSAQGGCGNILNFLDCGANFGGK